MDCRMQETEYHKYYLLNSEVYSITTTTATHHSKMITISWPAYSRIVCRGEVEVVEPGLEEAPQLEQAGQAGGAHVRLAPSGELDGRKWKWLWRKWKWLWKIVKKADKTRSVYMGFAGLLHLRKHPQRRTIWKLLRWPFTTSQEDCINASGITSEERPIDNKMTWPCSRAYSDTGHLVKIEVRQKSGAKTDQQPEYIIYKYIIWSECERDQQMFISQLVVKYIC